jgi:hypothetical protein
VLRQFDVKPIVLQPKEGLALINGTQFIAAIGSEAVVRAKECARVADLVAAFSVEGGELCFGFVFGSYHFAVTVFSFCGEILCLK